MTDSIEEKLREIEELLRDNNLDSLWSRELVRPALEFLLDIVKRQQRVIRGKNAALKISHKILCFLIVEQEPPTEMDREMISFIFNALNFNVENVEGE